MMRAAVFAKRGSQEVPAVLAAQTRSYIAPQSLSFTEDVALAKSAAKDAPAVLDDLKNKKSGTEQLLKLLQTYKDLGDSKAEPYLKYHNPRTFEDLSKPVPNFRSMNLKAGEVPKFFDNVLQNRAGDAVEQKNQWWADRKKEAEDLMKSKTFQPFAAVPVPGWSYGSSVGLDSLNKVTDAYVKALEPKRKLRIGAVPAQVKDSLSAFARSLGQDKSASEITEMVTRALAEKAVVTEGGKPLEGFKYINKAVAHKVISARRAEVHDRYLKFWAKKVLVAPETAVVPLKAVDSQLASRFEGVAPEYAELLGAVASGPKTLGERISASPAFTTFFLKREKEAVKGDFTTTEAEAEGVKLAAKLEDPEAALKELLGPEVNAMGAGAGPLSAQVKAIVEHKYTPDRYMYKEGMDLVAKLQEEEAALAKELKGAYGSDVDIKHFQQNPRTPVQQVFDRMREIELRSAEFEQEKSAAATPYEQYTLAKKQEFLKDPSNIAFEELLYPALSEEMMHVELAELAEMEAAIDEAEEEELWALTLAAQFRHIQKHFGVDLPHGVIAHMDPILVKKIDWETTNNLEDWDITLEDMNAEYAKEQWGVESLSHHFLPLIRYRRAKARRQGTKFDPELSAPLRH